ncbi:hypothetical protein BV96_02115 [Sphingomonas paucimobilis]|nr:hypothetical protein [Sphingobium sp. DC-2]EZP71984.1 hypothetical protein BV96_02115 [Sphingomonas paucimobilis]
MFKILILPKTGSGMSRHAMQDHLLTVHGPLSMRYAMDDGVGVARASG